jgi:hypothetical protein
MKKINWQQLLDQATPRETQNIETTLRRIWQQYHPTPEQIRARQENDDYDFKSEETGKFPAR